MLWTLTLTTSSLFCLLTYDAQVLDLQAAKPVAEESAFPDPTGKYSGKASDALSKENKRLREDLDAALNAALKLREQLGLFP